VLEPLAGAAAPVADGVVLSAAFDARVPGQVVLFDDPEIGPASAFARHGVAFFSKEPRDLIPYCGRRPVKFFFIFRLDLMMSMLLVGCGGGGGNAPAPIKPSATDFPFGVDSMDEEILPAELVYDLVGRVVEVHMTAEHVRSQDGRIDAMVSPMLHKKDEENLTNRCGR
jgi:hypothetical protein